MQNPYEKSSPDELEETVDPDIDTAQEHPVEPDDADGQPA